MIQRNVYNAPSHLDFPPFPPTGSPRESMTLGPGRCLFTQDDNHRNRQGKLPPNKLNSEEEQHFIMESVPTWHGRKEEHTQFSVQYP